MSAPSVAEVLADIEGGVDKAVERMLCNTAGVGLGAGCVVSGGVAMQWGISGRIAQAAGEPSRMHATV